MFKTYLHAKTNRLFHVFEKEVVSFLTGEKEVLGTQDFKTYVTISFEIFKNEFLACE